MPIENTAGVPPGIEPAIGDRLTTDDVAGLSGLTARTVVEYRSTRNRRRGPPFHYDGREVYYLLPEVLDWIDNRGTAHGRAV